MAVQIQFRRGTAQEWTLSNPILAEGEMGIELDTSLFKIGNGVDHWRDLQYGGLRGTTGYVGSLGNIAVQNVLYVSKSGNDSNDGRSLNTSKLTIKAALAIATYGTTIFVKSGVYTEDSPMVVPPHVAVVGDSLRTVTVRPVHPDRNLFYVNNGCYLAHMSFKDYISPAAAVSFPPDGSAGVIIQSPYVQNCTSLTSTGTGMRIDGKLAQGTKSMVVDAYTQYNQGGIGIHMLNRGYAQLVSVFTIACDKGFLAESGGFCSITNSNSSFGNYALYADGVSEPFQVITVTTSTKNRFTLRNVLTKPAVGDAIKFASTSSYLTVNTSTDLQIGNSPIQNPTISNESALLRNARNAILGRKTQIQTDTIIYLNETYPDFQFNQFKCNRDVGTIIDCVLYDMVLGSNYQSVAAGLAYTRQQSYIITATQLTETLSAIQFVKNYALSIISSGTLAYTRLFDNFDVVLNILENGPGFAPAVNYPNPSVIGTSTVVAKNQILANKDFIRAETLEYVSKYFLNFTYDKTKCARDTRLIIDGMITDLLFPANGYTQSNFSGLQYWNQNGYTGLIASELTTTTNAVRFINSLTQQIVQNITTGTRYQNTVTQAVGTATSSPIVTFINGDYNQIINILTSGTNGITDIVQNADFTVTPTNDRRNAYDLMQANKTFIQAETIAYINATTTSSFVYDQATCSRDVGYIVDSVSWDTLYNSNRQAIQSGVYYYSYSTTSSAIPHEQRKTSEAYDRLRDIIPRVIKSEPIVKSYGNTSTQNISLTPATDIQGSTLVSMLDLIINIISNGPSAAQDKKPISLIQNNTATVANAVAILQANKTFLVNEVISYIDMINHPGVDYNEATCYRDTGLIVDAIVQDMLFNGTTQSTFAGIQYWRQSNYVGAIADEISTTTAAVNYLSSLAQKVVQNISTTSYQSIVPRQYNTATAVNSNTAALIGADFAVITKILNSGTVGVTDSIVPNGITVSSSTEILNAVNSIRNNKSYLQAETIAWIDKNSTIAYYDQVKCTRDVGLIVDSLAFDILYAGTSQSTFAGLQYWNQNGYTGSIGSELSTTSRAIAYVRDSVISLVGTTSSQSVSNNFNKILYILNTGTAGVTDAIVPNGNTSSNIFIFNDYNTILANKATIQANTINYINTSSGSFVYNTATCYRDVGYILDSIAFDLLHGGNRQSVMSGVYYYGFNASSSSIPNETTQTVYAYNFINSISSQIIQGIAVTATYQNSVSQTITSNTATLAEVTQINSLINTVTNIIANGPSVAPAKLPIGLNADTNANKLKAYNLLLANRTFIQAETVAYVNQTFSVFQYDRNTCYRDVGYMIDSITIDLLYGGNKQAVQSGVAYYSYISTATVIPNEQIETVAAYEYIDNIARSIIRGELVSQNYSTSTQITNLSTATDVASVQVTNLINTITNIILNGPSVAAPLRPIAITASTDTNVLNAVSLLYANRAFIQAEVIGYINRTYPYLSLDVCGRDINYILNAVTYDLVYGGTSQSIVAGAAYYSGTQLTVESELDTIVEVYSFMSSLTQSVALGVAVTPLQTGTVQSLVSGSCSVNDATTIANLFQVINDILNYGYTVIVTTEETLPVAWKPLPGSRATTQGYSLIVSTGHSFEWIGAGTNINSAYPYNGGIPLSTNLAVGVNGGVVNFTGTDQRGDFRIGNDLVINRLNGTISGRTFNKSLFAVMTPYILAIGG